MILELNDKNSVIHNSLQDGILQSMETVLVTILVFYISVIRRQDLLFSFSACD